MFAASSNPLYYICLNRQFQGCGFQEEPVWLTQKQMAELFRRDRVAITQHLGNIFIEKELNKKSVCKDFLHTAADGKSYKTKYYNLDAIISVGYRVKSKRGTQFRQWRS